MSEQSTGGNQGGERGSGVKPVLVGIVVFAVGFVLGHIAADMNLIPLGGPSLSEPSDAAVSGTQTPREAAERGGAAVQDSAAETQDAVEDEVSDEAGDSDEG